VDYEDIRRLVIVAVFADPVLFERLIVKGGNALRLVHRIGLRTSLDVDFSTPGDLDELDTRDRMHRTLSDRFDSAGFEVFDFSLEPRPPLPDDPLMAGYEAAFKSLTSTPSSAADRSTWEARPAGGSSRRYSRRSESPSRCCGPSASSGSSIGPTGRASSRASWGRSRASISTSTSSSPGSRIPDL